MSFLSSITSAITDPGKLVSEVADAILPSNMKGIGEAIGGIVDLNTGHPLQALSHLSDALKDLPQLMGQSGAPAKAAAATPAGTAAAEPSPPSARSAASVANQAQSGISLSLTDGQGHTFTISESTTSGSAPSAKPPTSPSPSATPAAPAAANGATSLTSVAGSVIATPTSSNASASAVVSGAKQAATSSAQPNVTLSLSLVGGEKVTISESKPAAWANSPSGRTPAAAPAASGSTGSTSASSATATTAASATPSTSTTAATSSTTKPGAPSTTTGTSGTGGTSGTPSASGASGTSGAPSASGASGTSGTPNASGSSATPASLASLMAMSPDQFMQAVTSGQIPPDVANNQSAMMQVQARMNSITQMNQLVTSMMSAMHQMQMSIIQNIRC
jgi:hypothetical protein